MGFAKYQEDNMDFMLERSFKDGGVWQRDKVNVTYSPGHEFNAKLEKSEGKKYTDIYIHRFTVSKTNEVDIGKRAIAKNHRVICCDCGKQIDIPRKKMKKLKKAGKKPPSRCKSCKDYRDTLYLMRRPW